jgi:hypothetical protein
MHGSVLLEFSDFPLQDRDMLAQLARQVRAEPWRPQVLEHPGELFTLLC